MRGEMTSQLSAFSSGALKQCAPLHTNRMSTDQVGVTFNRK